MAGQELLPSSSPLLHWYLSARHSCLLPQHSQACNRPRLMSHSGLLPQHSQALITLLACCLNTDKPPSGLA